jgi:hypothetical protein
MTRTRLPPPFNDRLACQRFPIGRTDPTAGLATVHRRLNERQIFAPNTCLKLRFVGVHRDE